MTPTVKVNTAILSSIPLNKSMKNYFLSKYRWLVKHNGLEYACSIFQQMREISLAYRADRKRLEKRDLYISQMPVRKNGWLLKLFDYLDSHPEYVLNYLKLYVGLNDPIITVEQSADRQHQYLADVANRVDDSIPSFIKRWIKLVKLPIIQEKYYKVLFQGSKKPRSTGSYMIGKDLHGRPIVVNGKILRFLWKYGHYHSYQEYTQYIQRWKSALRVNWKQFNSEAGLAKVFDNAKAASEPLPEMYVDFDISADSVQSESLERDLWNFVSMDTEEGGWSEKPTLSPGSWSYVYRMLNPNLIILVDDWTNGENLPQIQRTFLDGQYVGYIHHIPKKGTVKRRPIAAPNRFLQMGMHPAYQVLREMVSHLPKDATFNQDRFDLKITNRVTNENLYVGSVDLSQATDNLPFSWGEYIWNQLVSGKVATDINKSWELFVECSRGRWYNDGIITSWTVGQPLGCLPSFMVLAMTHNIYLEALAFQQGYGHSPYVVLGDDVLILSKKLRKKYISDLQNRGIPLSLHKSYEGNLAEFAGKIYVRNHVPFHTSDQGAISFNNLFDYQRATGILIPWSNLPKKVRVRFANAVAKYGLRNTSVAPRIYSICQLAVIGKSEHPLRKEDEILTSYFYHDAVLSDQDHQPDPNLQSGIVMISGHPITYLDYGYAEKHGFKQRYREVGLPDWYKRKFRPDSTDKIVHCATLAVKEVLNWT